MSPQDFLASRTEQWALALAAVPSVTGTADEAAFAEKLAAMLSASPAFRGEDAVWTVPVPGGAYPRRCVLALARGSGRRTVVLTGHFDIVETGCYGALEPLALKPRELRDALIAAIEAEPHDARAQRALEDLKSGDFVPGRGLLDMKGGLAAGLAVIEAMAQEGFAGNLLFVAVPDEEGNSAGARTMSQVLPEIAAARGLDIQAVVNLDATVDDGDGAAARVVALGSVGKLLPSALVVGRPAHASDSYKGFGAAALAGALAAEMEWMPDLAERTDAETAAGATLLGMKDEKTAYDVTMPASVWMYWNVMVHRRSSAAVLDALAHASRRAADALSARLVMRAATAGVEPPLHEVAVLRYETLLDEAQARDGEAGAMIAALAGELAASALSLPEQCRLLTERTWRASGRSGPAIVLGFASIPYLPVELRDDEPARRLEAAVEAARAETAAAFGTTIGTIRYFPGISDVSFFGQADPAHLGAVAANTPQWRGVLAGASDFGTAGYPSVNVGPWGRDYHTRLERMHAGYGYRVLPALLRAIATRVLAGS